MDFKKYYSSTSSKRSTLMRNFATPLHDTITGAPAATLRNSYTLRSGDKASCPVNVIGVDFNRSGQHDISDFSKPVTANIFYMVAHGSARHPGL